MINGLSSGYSAVSILSYSTPGAGIDFTTLFGGGAGASASVDPASMPAALQQAEKNETKELAQVAKDPIVQKDIARYTKVVKSAKTIDDVLNDPIARKVFMKSAGLGSQVDAVGLAKRVLKSDPTDPKSDVNKMASVNGTWLDVVVKYNFELFGVARLKTSDALKEVTGNYVAETRLDRLDQKIPGLGSAILFMKSADKLDNAIKILGSPLGREVVTTALSLPKQLALQSLVAQEKAINQRINPAKLKDDEFARKIALRYLVVLNGGASGVTA